MTGRKQCLVAVDVVPLDEWIVPEGVLDFDRWRLEEGSFAFSIRAIHHSIPSIVIASSL